MTYGYYETYPNPPKDSVAIDPVLTTTAYKGLPGFYTFYHRYEDVTGPVLTDLSWLRLNVSAGLASYAGWGADYPLYLLMKQKQPSIGILTDLQVGDGGLFYDNGTRRYSTAVLGHDEYVTQSEYDQFEAFVAKGGTLDLVGGDSLEVLVNYTNGVETFVLGHGWSFNGTAAVKSAERPFEGRNVGLLGGSYYQGQKVEDAGFEVNVILNFTSTAVSQPCYSVSGPNTDILVAYYSHQYKQGTVDYYCVDDPNGVRGV